MKKKIVAVLCMVAMATLLIACGDKTCKADGCDEEIAEDGYCSYHYILDAGEDVLKDLVN